MNYGLWIMNYGWDKVKEEWLAVVWKTPLMITVRQSVSTDWMPIGNQSHQNGGATKVFRRIGIVCDDLPRRYHS
jgi:hypothetical protein